MSEASDNTPKIIDLLKRFMVMAEERAKTLPYRINLIETLGGACETENSKILAAFLRYKTPSGRFEILESLIEYIQSRFDVLLEIKVDRPSVNTEHCHIDIYVRETHKYAIIIENKSNWAGDQDEQLSRYIETAIREGFAESQIYVLYLPPLEGKEPVIQSWGKFKNAFQNRYVKLSWRDDILPWMRGKVLPNVRYKDIPLSSAFEQYIDYWEGQFGLRGVQSEVKREMRETVIEGLALGSEQDAGKSLAIVREAFVAAQALTKTLAGLANERKASLEYRFWNELIDALNARGLKDVDRINICEKGILKNYSEQGWYSVGIRVHFYVDNHLFFFDCMASQGAGYFGFKFMDESGHGTNVNKPAILNAQSKRIEQIVTSMLPRCIKPPSWYGCVSSKELDFRQMWYETIIDLLGTPEKCTSCAHSWSERFDGYIKKFTELMKAPQP